MKSVLLALVLAFALPARAVELRWPEGTVRGFPVVRDEQGRQIGDGQLTQWIEDGKLHVLAMYEFRDGRHVEERAEFAQHPELAQLRWSWEERRGDEVERSYSVDFETGHAVAKKRGEAERSEVLDDARKAGRAFAGVGFMYALKNLSDRLDRGETIELVAVAFTPKPRTSTVSVHKDQVATLSMGGRALPAARYVIHPEVPWIAKLFVKAPDQYLWFYRPDPPAFVRGDLPLAEPSDEFIRVELLGGEGQRSQARSPRHR